MEIARFRLLLAALQAAGVTRLAAAPEFRFNLAVGDSLLHGRHFGGSELGGADEGLRRVARGITMSPEDTAELDAILGRQYHAVVGNPPYITPKDAAMRDAYREIYDSCHRKYALACAVHRAVLRFGAGGTTQIAGGLRRADRRQQLHEARVRQEADRGRVLPRLDLTHVVGLLWRAYMPGHGTPTAILFGRNRAPVRRRGANSALASGASLSAVMIQRRAWSGSAIWRKPTKRSRQSDSSALKTRLEMLWRGIPGTWVAVVRRSYRRRLRRIDSHWRPSARRSVSAV